MAGLVRHRQTKGPGTDRPRLNHRATSRLYRNALDGQAFSDSGVRLSRIKRRVPRPDRALNDCRSGGVPVKAGGPSEKNFIFSIDNMSCLWYYVILLQYGIASPQRR